MQHERSRELARRLAARCDLVTNNFRPGVMERWGLGYEQRRRAQPEVIYLSMPMQGSEGPHSRYIGFGATIAALAGLVHLSGRPDRPPDRHRHALSRPRPEPRARARRACSPRSASAAAPAKAADRGLAARVDGELIAPALAAPPAGDPQLERDGNRFRGALPERRLPLPRRRRLVRHRGTRATPSGGRSPRCSARPGSAPTRASRTHAARKANEDELETRARGARSSGRERRELAGGLQARGVPASPCASRAATCSPMRSCARAASGARSTTR